MPFRRIILVDSRERAIQQRRRATELLTAFSHKAWKRMEEGVIDAVYPDGTYDVLVGARRYPWSKLRPADLKSRYRKGDCVVIGFLEDSPFLPFILCTGRVSGGRGPGITINSVWFISHGSERNAFLAGASNAAPSIEESAVWAGPFADAPDFFAVPGIVGMVAFEEDSSIRVAVLAITDNIPDADFRLTCLDSSGEVVWETDFAYAFERLHAGINLQYNPVRDLLVVTTTSRQAQFSNTITATTWRCFNASTGASLGVHTDTTTKHFWKEGWMMTGSRVVRTYHVHGFSSGSFQVGSSTPLVWPITAVEIGTAVVNNAFSASDFRDQARILGAAIAADLSEDGDPLTLDWEFHPGQLYDSGNQTVPARCVVKSLGASGTSPVDQMPVCRAFPAPYLPSRKSIVVPVSAHIALSTAEPENFGHFQKSGYMAYLNNMPDQNGVADVLNCREFTGWLAALKVANGRVDWKRKFATITSLNSAHYVVDDASFGNYTPPSPTTDVTVIDGSGRTLTVNTSWTYIGKPDDQQWDVEASTYTTPTSDASYPSSGGVAILGAGGGSVLPTTITGSEAAPARVPGRSAKLFPQYLYWPMSAGYHFDPTPAILAGDLWVSEDVSLATGGAGHAPSFTGAQVATDEDDNIYLVRLQPYGIVSCRHPLLFKTYADALGYHDHATKLAGKRITATTVGPGPNPNVVQDVTWEVCDLPWRHVAFRSFLLKFDSEGNQLLEKELTFWGSDYQFSSASLAGTVPYAGCCLRISPASTVLFVLRTIRLPVSAPATIPANISGTIAGDVLDYAGHRGTRFCKTVLEAYRKTDFELLWQETLYNPADDGSATLPTTNPPFTTPTSRYHLDAFWMYGSEGSNEGDPWIIGHIRHGDVLKVFRADSTGVVELRDGEDNDPVSGQECIVADGHLYYRWKDADDIVGDGVNKEHLRRF